MISLFSPCINRFCLGKSEKNDKAIATDDCICNENKNTDKSKADENTKTNEGVKDILTPNNATNETPATPRARSRARRRTRR